MFLPLKVHHDSFLSNGLMLFYAGAWALRVLTSIKRIRELRVLSYLPPFNSIGQVNGAGTGPFAS